MRSDIDASKEPARFDEHAVPDDEPCPDEEIADVAVRRHAGATVVDHDPSVARSMERRS